MPFENRTKNNQEVKNSNSENSTFFSKLISPFTSLTFFNKNKSSQSNKPQESQDLQKSKESDGNEINKELTQKLHYLFTIFSASTIDSVINTIALHGMVINGRVSVNLQQSYELTTLQHFLVQLRQIRDTKQIHYNEFGQPVIVKKNEPVIEKALLDFYEHVVPYMPIYQKYLMENLQKAIVHVPREIQQPLPDMKKLREQVQRDWQEHQEKKLAFNYKLLGITVGALAMFGLSTLFSLNGTSQVTKTNSVPATANTPVQVERSFNTDGQQQQSIAPQSFQTSQPQAPAQQQQVQQQPQRPIQTPQVLDPNIKIDFANPQPRPQSQLQPQQIPIQSQQQPQPQPQQQQPANQPNQEADVNNDYNSQSKELSLLRTSMIKLQQDVRKDIMDFNNVSPQTRVPLQGSSDIAHQVPTIIIKGRRYISFRSNPRLYKVIQYYMATNITADQTNKKGLDWLQQVKTNVNRDQTTVGPKVMEILQKRNVIFHVNGVPYINLNEADSQIQQKIIFQYEQVVQEYKQTRNLS
jgi:hypothetical protein